VIATMDLKWKFYRFFLNETDNYNLSSSSSQKRKMLQNISQGLGLGMIFCMTQAMEKRRKIRHVEYEEPVHARVT
jgi:hypothetical protein